MTQQSGLNIPQPVSYKANFFKKINYIIELSLYIKQEKAISLTRQYCEMIFLYAFRRLGPILYFEARLWRKKLSLAEKMRFLNSSQYKQRINQLNPAIYRKFSNDKLVEKSILSLLGIPTAKFLGFFHPYTGSDCYANPLTNTEELKKFLAAYLGKKLCFKLTEGWGGDGFIAAEVVYVRGEIGLHSLKVDGVPSSIEEFFESYLVKYYHNGFVIEFLLEQHPELAAFNCSSVNTIRMWLIQSKTKVKVLGAVLRIGRQGQLVDNCGQGGLVCLLNAENGIIKHGMTPTVIPTTFDRHPDNQAQLTGVQLPYWDECLEIGRSCLRVFPHINFVGLDIAFTNDGPVIVELNEEPDKISARVFGLPTKDLLNNDSF